MEQSFASAKVWLLLACSLFALVTFAQKDYESLTRLGYEYYNNGKYDTAKIYAYPAIGAALKEYGVNSWQYSRAYLLVGACYAGQKPSRMDSALLFYRKALYIAERLNPPCDSILYKPVRNLSNYFLATKKYDSAAYYIPKRLDLLSRIYGKTSKEYIDALNYIGTQYFNAVISDSIPDFTRAFDFYYEALNIGYSAQPSLDSMLYWPIANLSNAYMRKGPPDSASSYNNKRLELVQRFHGETSVDYINELCEIGRRFWLNKQLDSAKKYYNLSLPIRANVINPQSELVVRHLLNMVDSIEHESYNYYSDLCVANFELHSRVELDSIWRSANKKGNTGAAIYWLEQLKDKALIQNGEPDTMYAFSLQLIGEEYSNWHGYLPVSEYCINEALRVLRTTEGELNINVADAYASMGLAYQNRGDYLKSISNYQKALDIYEKKIGKFSRRYENALLGFAKSEVFHCGHADFDSVFPAILCKYQSALEISDSLFGKESLYSNAVKLHLASAFQVFAKLDKAIDLKLQGAKKIADSSGEVSQEYCSIASGISTTYFYMEDLKNSEKWAEIALEIRGKLSPERGPEYFNALINVAQSTIKLGQYDKTQKLLDTAFALYNRKPGYMTSDGYAIYCEVQADLNIAMDKFEHTDTLILRKLAYDLRTHEGSIHDEKEPVFDYQKLGLVYLKTNQYQKSHDALFKALEVLQSLQIESTAAGSTCYEYLGDYYHAIGKKDSAVLFYELALKGLQLTFSDKNISYQEAAEKLARVYWQNHEYAKTEEILNKACSNITGNMFSNFSDLSEDEKLNYIKTRQPYIHEYYSLNQIVNKINPASVGEAYQLMLDTKGMILNSTTEIKKGIFSSKDSLLHKLYDQLVQTRASLLKSYGLSKDEQHNRGLSSDSLEQAAGKLEKEIALRSEQFKTYKEQSKVTVSDVSNSLKPDEAAVEFVSFPFFNGSNWTDSTLYAAFVLRHGERLPHYLYLTTGNELAPFVGMQGVPGRGLKAQQAEQNTNAFRKLYDILWQPLSKYLNGVKTVYIATDGLTNNVSFSSLQDTAGIYLSDTEKFDLHYVLSSRDVIAVKRNTELFKQKTIALFGGARYDLTTSATLSKSQNKKLPASRDVSRIKPLEYLPATLTEVNNIASTLNATGGWKVQLDTGVKATEERFDKLGGDHAPDIIHIATHGFYFPEKKALADTLRYGKRTLVQESDNPLIRSGIMLSGSNRAWMGLEGQNEEDGIVTAYQIANMDLVSTDLAVLSACETGLGDIRGGEGVFGLQRALRQAGVDKIIVSLWSVADDETSELMQVFYKNLASGLNYRDSFRKAQDKVKASNRNNPYLWAGFVLIE